MQLRFWGAAGTVTGSRFLLNAGGARVLIDCGLYQGYKWLRERNWQKLPFDVKSLDAVILTHAHLDHSGYLPVLYRAGFRGPIYCHDATRALCEILLEDSGKLQEEDARFYARHRIGRHANPEPLYDRELARQTCGLFKSVPFAKPKRIKDLTFHLQSAGHILGASSIIIEADGKRIGFSGDVGRPGDVLMLPPEPLPELDALVLESTYGDRLHETTDPSEHLAQIVNETAAEGGVLVVPTFAVGRAQALQEMLLQLKQQGKIPDLPVYLDSPMAIDVSNLYEHYQNQHRLSREECRHWSDNTIYTPGVEESKAIEHIKYPHIILAGSGMATGGRVLHHLKRLLPKHRTTVLFTGHQAGGTRGARLIRGEDEIKIHGEYIPVKARIEILDGLSGHADYAEMLAWLQQSTLRSDMRIYLVHGEQEALDAMRIHLEENTPCKVHVAEHGERIRI